MKVGWLVDQHDWEGGGELTMKEFRRAAPDDVEIVNCPPGHVEPNLDRYAIGNCVQYSIGDLNMMGRVKPIKFVNDIWPHGDPQVRAKLLAEASLIFCSPLHQQRFPHGQPEAVALIPPPLNLAEFRKQAGHKPPAKREGTCWIGMAFYGKGIRQAEEWAQQNGPVDFYGSGPFVPQASPVIRPKGHLPYEKVAETLARYERFLFLPTQVEPFGRSAAEAWASGCKLTVNRNLGCLYWIQEEPGKLETAAEDFWAVVLG